MILTKLEEVLRTRQIKIYSSRLYEELKTFVWKGKKAQARKGANDDLIMALAIGVWLYDTSPQLAKVSVDINKAMLSGFAVNTTELSDTVLDKQASSIVGPRNGEVRKTVHPNQGGPTNDFSWILK